MTVRLDQTGVELDRVGQTGRLAKHCRVLSARLSIRVGLLMSLRHWASGCAWNRLQCIDQKWAHTAGVQ